MKVPFQRLKSDTCSQMDVYPAFEVDQALEELVQALKSLLSHYSQTDSCDDPTCQICERNRRAKQQAMTCLKMYVE